MRKSLRATHVPKLDPWPDEVASAAERVLPPIPLREWWQHSGDDHNDSVLSTADVQSVRDFVDAGEGDKPTEHTWSRLLPKMRADPRNGDCALLLTTTAPAATYMGTCNSSMERTVDFLDKYDAVVHAHTVQLTNKLANLMRSEDEQEFTVRRLCVRALGTRIFKHGGIYAMHASAHVVCNLLFNEIADLDAVCAINASWNGVGEWRGVFIRVQQAPDVGGAE